MQTAINTFIKSTIDVLKIQTKTEAVVGKAEVQKNSLHLNGDVSGIIALVSSQVSGSFIISFPADTYLKILSSMLRTEFKELKPEIADGASELANMILGTAKAELNQKGFNFQSAIPTVVMGKSHIFPAGKNMTSLLVPFTSNFGNFTIEFRMIS